MIMCAKSPPLDNVVKIPRGKLCFPDLAEKAWAKRMELERWWDKDEDPWVNDDPPVPEPLPHDEHRFLTHLKWADPYHTRHVLDLRTELTELLSAMALHPDLQQNPQKSRFNGKSPTWYTS